MFFLYILCGFHVDCGFIPYIEICCTGVEYRDVRMIAKQLEALRNDERDANESGDFDKAGKLRYAIEDCKYKKNPSDDVTWYF